MKWGILSVVAALATAAADSQVVFDSDQNLYLLGVANKDFAAGSKKNWNSSSSFDNITKGDRPSFDTANPNCWLSQYNNGAYCLNVEKSEPNSVYILDFDNKEWTKKSAELTDDDKPSLDNLEAVLDHDTNVWYGLDGDTLYSLEMGDESLIPNDTLTWNVVEQPPFTTDDYNPVIGLASNHLHFIDVPGADPGEAHLFVIHYSYFQPEAQKYGDWNQQHGKTASVFKSDNEWQTKFWFIPDSGENSYLIDVESNTTTTFDGPTKKDKKADYASTQDTLVQLTSTSELYYLDFSEEDSAEWKQVENTALPIMSNNSVTKNNGGDSNTDSNGDSTDDDSGANSITATLTALIALIIVPGRVSSSGYPFKPLADKPQPPSPALNYLFRQLALTLPGFNTISPELWQQVAQGLLERLAAQDLSDSFDKGLLGKRKILGQGIIVIAEYALRGVLGGLPRKNQSTYPKDARECSYDPQNPTDVQNAWSDFLQGLVYGNYVEDLIAYVEKTDNLQDLPSLYQAAHSFASATLASFLHYLFTRSPCAQSTVSLISRIHNLLPYSLVGVSTQVANAATMISGVLKIFLSRNPLGYVGIGSGNNLLQTIITSVLGKDKSNLQKQWADVERKEAENGATTAQKEAIQKYVDHATREERVEIRSQTIENNQSIIITILSREKVDLPSSEKAHSTLLTQLTLQLAIRDRYRLIDALVDTKPDLVSLCVTEALNAFEPLIRKLHKSVNLKETLEDLQIFIDDLVKIAKEQVGPRAYIDLFNKHQKNLHKFLHNLVKNAPEMKDMYLSWYMHSLNEYRTSSEDVTEEECTGAGDYSGVLQELFDQLDPQTQDKVMKELDEHVTYQNNVLNSSKQKMNDLLDRSKTEPGIGPGVFIAVWQDMIDKNPITPITMHGRVRNGADQAVQQASNIGIENQEQVDEDVIPESTEHAEDTKDTRSIPLYGEGTVRPDCATTLEALEGRFDKCLRERCM
ncbi:hypothetical protein E3P78_00703 [Wallemia ichthyophaga]|nr:hypothetical protein E3P78_00703 [Wallemia ichthyophaga]